MLLKSNKNFMPTSCRHWYEDAHTYLVDTYLIPKLMTRQDVYEVLK